jgi:hypothetical protein
MAALNIFFFVFHTALMIFNLFGWMHPRTRRWCLVTLLATLFSWVVMGAWHGWGYCLCTDWHFRIRRTMGFEDHVQTYVQLILLKLTGIRFNTLLVEVGTFCGFLFGFVGAVVTNVRDWHRRRSTLSHFEA